MDESLMNQVVKVSLVGIEKKKHRDDAMFIGSNEGRKTYSYNLLYENTADPKDSVHRLTLQPDNANFIKIDKELKDVSIDDLTMEDFKRILSPALLDMYGAWVIVDMSATPVCRVYTENVSKLVNGEPKVIHEKGTFIHKTDVEGKETDELAIITQLPVWGFLREMKPGAWGWLKGEDPKLKIDRQIQQGRMKYVSIDKDTTVDNEPPAEEANEPTKPLGLAPGLDTVID